MFLRPFPKNYVADGASGLITGGMSRRSSLASLLLERLGEEEEERKVPVPSMSMPFRVLGDEELPAWLGLPWSPKSWPPSSSSQVLSSGRSSSHYDAPLYRFDFHSAKFHIIPYVRLCTVSQKLL